MSCYHPLKAFPVGVTANGKTDYKICSYGTRGLYYNGSSWIPYTRFTGFGYPVITEYIEIPCGQCIGCRLAHAKEWADRCMFEAREHEHNWFLTLTYDDDHIHVSAYGDRENGEAVPDFTLCKRDLQLFWKRLRKSSGVKLRYFACGEYG